jgi:hypothetical protein
VNVLGTWAEGSRQAVTIGQAPLDVRFRAGRILQPDAFILLERLWCSPAAAPQRRRVAEFVAEAELAPAQIAAIEAAVDEAAGAIADRVFQGLTAGLAAGVDIDSMANRVASSTTTFAGSGRVCGCRRRSPDDRHAVGRELRVRGRDRQPLDDRLGDEQPVEWIAMVERQLCNADEMGVGDGEELELASLYLASQESLEGGSELELAQRQLHGDLPEARDAQHLGHRWIADRRSGTWAQTFVVEHEPQERVGVDEEQAHE